MSQSYYELFKILTVMYIDKLIKNVEKNIINSKRQLLTPNASYKLKTCESIGTLNSLGQQNQRQFIISDNNMTPYRKNIICQTLSANPKLDQQLTQIERMKNLYQSRQIKNKGKARSIQRSSASGQKSSQKHILKPSNTPSFNKVTKLIRTQQQKAPECKNLYGQNIFGNSLKPNNMQNNKQVDNKIVYQIPDQSLHIQDHQQQPYQQQPYQHEQQSLSQIAHISQQLPHMIYQYNIKKPIPDTCQQIWQRDTQSIANLNLNDTHALKQKNTTVQNLCNINCVSRQEFMELMQTVQSKFDKIADKINQLQLQNRKLKQTHEQIKRTSYQYQSVIKEEINQKNRILDELKRQQKQKEQLQSLLKDVLYKRQRERVQNSKQNTYRQNEKSDRKITNYSFGQSQSTCDLKTSGRNSNVPQSKQSQSKMKVQNLLNKLQIKVDRV